MGEIDFDFGLANQVKNQVEEMVRQMDTGVLLEFEGVMQEVSRAWKGDTGDQFLKITEQEMDQMKQTVQLLKCVDTGVQDAILTAEQTENKVKEIAKLRIY